MKHFAMSGREKPPRGSVPHRPGEPAGVPDAAFDLWLQRSLHQLFDKVAKEPIPHELLRLIEGDRDK
jgi:hypothetical protein